MATGTALALLVGCSSGSDQDKQSDLPEGVDSAITVYQDSVSKAATHESTAAAVERAPRVVAGDTLVTSIDYRCSGGVIAAASYWVGPNERVTLALGDTGVSLLRVRSADGARYALQKPAIEWWEKGDSATFTRNGKRHQCGADPTVQF